MNRVSSKFKIQNSKFKLSLWRAFRGSGSKNFTPHSSFFILHFSFFIFFFLLVFACRRYNTQQTAQDAAEIERLKKEVLLRVNQQFVEEEIAEIDAFAERNGWQMKTTESGLRYMIYETGKGEKAAMGMTVTLEYTVSLLDCTVCYSSVLLGPKVFRLGYSDVETGLEEGVLLMQAGDKARMILPPHLAYGLTGDGNCIPLRAIILYDVGLVSVQ